MTAARVCHVVSGIDVGGAETRLLALCEGLVDRGYDVDVAYLKGDGELAEDFRSAGCGVERIGIRTDADPVGLVDLTRHVRGSYDLLHGHLFHGNVYAAAAATLANTPSLVASKHNDPPFWRHQPYRTIHEATLLRADRVLPISDHVREYLLETTRVDPAKVRTVRYGLDPAPFDSMSDEQVAAAREEFAPEGAPLVGTVARLTEQKDLETLLEAFARLNVPEARLVIVGRGERRERLEALAVELAVDDRVTFAGFRGDVPALMRAFDVFALPSRWEGFGVVILEAMASGTPVVASRTSAIPEVVVDGETGILCPQGDSEAFADAIDELLADPKRAAAMGRAGRERVGREFTVDRMVDEVASVYDAVLGHSPRGRTSRVNSR